MQYGVEGCWTELPSQPCMGVKLGLSHQTRKTGWGWQGIRRRERNLELRERKLQKTGENYIARSFMVIWAHKIGPPVIVTMGWAWHVACMNGRENYLGVFVVKIEKREHLYDLGVDGRTILKLDIQEIELEEVDGSQLSEDHTRGRLLSRQWWNFLSIEGDELWTNWATVIVSSRCDPNLIHLTSTEFWAQNTRFLVYGGYCVRLGYCMPSRKDDNNEMVIGKQQKMKWQ